MLLTVSIVNWNTTGLLRTLLMSIYAHSPSTDMEVFVVDNASKDFNLSQMQTDFPYVKYIVNQNNEGYAHGNNQVLEQAKGDFILLLNPDTEITDNAIQKLMDFMQQNPDAGAVGSKLVRPDGTVDRSLRSFPYPGAIAWEFTGFSKLFPKNRFLSAYRMTYFDYESTAEVDQPMGSCLMLSGKALKTIGLMDEQFPIFFNEVDWLYRVKKAKYKVYYTPDAVVIHHGASSTKQVAKRLMSIESHKSLLKFYEKHFKGQISPLTYYFVVACIKLSILIKETGN